MNHNEEIGNPSPGDPRVVYRRADGPAGGAGGSQAPTPAGAGLDLAPAVTPLIVGFTLLLMVISVLGYLSAHRVDDVAHRVFEMEHQHAAQVNLLLQLRLALTKLDNEARARQDAEAGRGIKPPFDLPLRTAREEMKKQAAPLERPPLSQDEDWSPFRADLESYLIITGNSRRYSLEGFATFHKVDEELNKLFSKSPEKQTKIIEESERIQQQAVRSIRLWSVIALVVGFVVATGTIWEVQRRFRQLRRSAEEVRRERSFSNQMLEGMVSAVVAIDQDDRIRSANRAFFEIFPSASIGAYARAKLASDEAMKMLEMALASQVQQTAYRGRYVGPSDKPMGPRSFDVYSSPLAIGGNAGQIVTLVDVTEAAQAERVMRRNESLAAVGQATTQVAHEIKNPLGTIRLGVSMLRDSVKGDIEALRTIDLVERGVNHLNKLVIDVTEFSRQKPLTRTSVELTDLINRSLELVTERIQEKATPVAKNFSSVTLKGSWDADQLVQVFVNVIANAIDASPKGRPISVETELVKTTMPGSALSATSGTARVIISDQGRGMDQATQDRIFEPFFSTKRRGTGLGLAIVKQIIEQHGGRIFAESEVGKGSRFIIDLPL